MDISLFMDSLLLIVDIIIMNPGIQRFSYERCR